MMKTLERIIYLFIVVCSIVFSCNTKSDTKIAITPADTVFATVTIDSLIPYDTIIYNTDTLWLHDTVNTKSTDTVYVYNDFFKMYKYEFDTTIQEVNINSKINITQNRLYNLEISARNNRESQIIMTKDNKFGIGGVVGVDLIAPALTYESNKHQFGLGYNFANKSGIILSYQYKIDLKR